MTDQRANESVPTTPQQALQALVRQAEMQQLQLKLEVTFKRNMEAFKAISPQIYNQFINYKPQELRLIYTEEGYLSLVNFQLNNKPVYAENPAPFTDRQYEAFCRSPMLSNISFAPTKIHNEEHIHPKTLNNLIRQYQETKGDIRKHIDVPIGFMLVTGCGLGYHIERMCNDLDIRNLCIFDPHKDSFYASLHTIDWVGILQKMTSKGRMLKLLIGVDHKDAMVELKLQADKIGLFNFVYTFIYRHFSSPKENEFIETYKKEYHLAATGTGFFDDEQISLAHTVHNLNSHFPFLYSGARSITDIPVFLLGNGPSLDAHIDYLKTYQNNAIVITCGTALSSLAKTGIKPDFHVEMERSAITPSYIKHGTTEEYRKGITLICLNTAAPQMTELFEHVCIATKPNDLGENIINSYYDDTPPRLLLCNPTVTNAGLAASLLIGFREIILLGVDLGMKDDSSHHSSLSIYYDIERKKKEKSAETFTNYATKGNFGGEVLTNPILHATKHNFEILIREMERSGVALKIYNPNDGAYIEGTIPTPKNDLPNYEMVSPTHKEAVISEIKSNCIRFTSPVTINENKFKKRFLRHFPKLKKRVSLPERVANPHELLDVLNSIFKTVVSQEPVPKLLLRGSINSVFTLLVQTTLFTKDEAIFKSRYREFRAQYQNLLDIAFNLMEEKPLQCDTTVDKEAIKLSDSSDSIAQS